MSIDWAILERAMARPGPGERFNEAFERGAVRGAMARAANGDPRALGVLYQFDPQAAMHMEDRRYQQAERQRAADGRNALAEYLIGGSGGQASAPPTNALLPSAATATPGALSNATGAPSALPVAPGAPSNALAALPPSSSISAVALPGSPAYPTQATQPPGFSPPMSARERAVRADPAAFMEVEGRQLQNRVRQVELTQGQFELMRDLNDFSLSTLGSVEAAPAEQRPALYTEALARARQFYVDRGLEAQFDALNLPQQYDPARVGMMLQQSMRGKEQLDAMRAERRLTWDIEDDELDNERADENLESLVDWRRSGLGLRAAEEAARDRRFYEGQNRTDRRFNEGQNRTDRRFNEGQDRTDRRATLPQRPRARRGAGTPNLGEGAIRRNRATGQTQVLRNGQWVNQ